MISIREEAAAGIGAREALLDEAFGPARFQKTCERLREGRVPALALVADDAEGRIVGTVRLWNVTAGPGRPALMLGPLAVAGDARGQGLGGRMMRAALNRAALMGHRAVLLVGDAAYYERFGFSADLTGALWMPGPVERERFLGLDLREGALAGASGLVSATGAAAPRPSLAELVAALDGAGADAQENLAIAA